MTETVKERLWSAVDVEEHYSISDVQLTGCADMPAAEH